MCIELILNKNRGTWKISGSQSVKSGLPAACKSSSARDKERQFERGYLDLNTNTPCSLDNRFSRRTRLDFVGTEDSGGRDHGVDG